MATVDELGVDTVRFEAYAAKRWGIGWKGNQSGRRMVLQEVESFRSDPGGLTQKMDAELDVLS